MRAVLSFTTPLPVQAPAEPRSFTRCRHPAPVARCVAPLLLGGVPEGQVRARQVGADAVALDADVAQPYVARRLGQLEGERQLVRELRLGQGGEAAEDLRVDADLFQQPRVVGHHVDEVDLHQLADEARRPGQLVQLLLALQRLLDVRPGDADPVRDRGDGEHRLHLGRLAADLGGGLAGQPQALFLAGAGAVDGDVTEVQAHPADVGGDAAVARALDAGLGPYPQFVPGDRQPADRAHRVRAHFAEFDLGGAQFTIHVVEGEQYAAVHSADRGALDRAGQIAVDADVVGARLEFRQGDPVGREVRNGDVDLVETLSEDLGEEGETLDIDFRGRREVQRILQLFLGLVLRVQQGETVRNRQKGRARQNGDKQLRGERDGGEAADAALPAPVVGRCPVLALLVRAETQAERVVTVVALVEVAARRLGVGEGGQVRVRIDGFDLSGVAARVVLRGRRGRFGMLPGGR